MKTDILQPSHLVLNSKKSLILVCSFFLIRGLAWSQEEIILPSITTYIESDKIEQRQVLTSDEIQSLHVESLTDLLQAQGIQILSYGPYGLQQVPSIRGFTDETVRVVIDGVCVNNAQYGTFDFSSININDIEKIEIVRGGFTQGVCDEGAVGGVIYITTKKQQLGKSFDSDSLIKSYFNVNLPLDTFSQSLRFACQTGENTFLKTSVKGTWANNRFLYINDENKRRERTQSCVKDANASLQLLHYFGNGNYFSLSDLFYTGKKEVAGTESSAFSGIQKDLSNKVIASVNFPALKDCVRLENSLAWLCDNRSYEEGQQESIHHVNTIKLSSSAVFNPMEKLTQSAGITLEYTNLNSTDDGRHNQFGLTIKETSKIKFSDVFSLSLPLAFKLCNKNLAFVPKLGFSAEFDHINLIFNACRMVQFPNMDDLYWNGGGFRGNPDLKNESGWGGELCFNLHDIFLPFSLCIFSNYYANKIQWDISAGQPQNISSAFYLGLDFTCKKTLGPVTIQLNGEYLYNRLLNAQNKLTYKKRIMWTPDFTAGLCINTVFESFVWNIDASYTGKRYTSNQNLYTMDPYLLLNASFELVKFGWIIPYLHAENLLNTDYQAAEEYPMPGISLAIGVKISK